MFDSKLPRPGPAEPTRSGRSRREDREGTAGAESHSSLARQGLPRERLITHGARTLSDSELLSVLLRTGSPGLAVERLSQDLLETHEGLAGLRFATPLSLDLRGMGLAKIASVLAATELAKRLAAVDVPERQPMHQPERAVRYLALRYGLPDQEVMGAIYLDARHRLMETREIYRGGLHRASVEPRGLLKPALLIGAKGLVLFHTHPSGDPTPSAEDVAFTRRMAEASAVLGVDLVDHLVLGSPRSWVSLRAEGVW